MEAPIVPHSEYVRTEPLKDRLKFFNTFANNHIQKQAINPFSDDKQVSSLQKRRFSKEEYGRPEKGSKSEMRAFKASVDILKEMLELCEILNFNSEPLFTPDEKKNDPRKVISFGELFNLYNMVSSQLVGMLLRARKQKFVDFEGECLFQRRDDHVPIILLKPIQEIRKILNEKIQQTLALIENIKNPPIHEVIQEVQ